jgi:heptosyltransferase-2
MSTVVRTLPQRILVVTLADLGDALLTTPALHALRQALPHARIDVLTTSIGAAALQRAGSEHSTPVFNDLILFEKHRFDTPRALIQPANLHYSWRLWRRLRSGSYDACIMLHHLTTWFGTLKYAALAYASGAAQRYGLHNGRGFFLTHRLRSGGFGARHQVEYWQDLVALLGVQPTLPSPGFVATTVDQDAATDLLASFQPPTPAAWKGPARQPGPPLVALHPGSGAYAPARRWPPACWAALADALIADGAKIILLGGKEEADLRRSMLGAMRQTEQILDLGGRTTLGQLAAVLPRCDLFVGNDSGVAHLAGSVGTPVVAVFGPTDPLAWGPYGGEAWHIVDQFPNGVQVLRSGPHRALHAAIACSPCIYRGHSLGTPHGCPDRTCLLRINVEQVLQVVRTQLATVAPVHHENPARYQENTP